MSNSTPIPPAPDLWEELEPWLATFTNWERQTPLASDRRSLGPSRCRSLLLRAGIAAPRGPVIQVAGTKGKGSTVLWMESLLGIKKLPSAATLSPHLETILERIRVDGKQLTEKQTLEGLKRLQPFLSPPEEEAAPTFFDLWTALFVERAGERGDRWLLLEVVLGGPLDSTSAIPHDVAILTTVDLDHRAILGETIEEIATEKAGIATSGKPFIIATGPADAVSAAIARERGAAVQIVEEDHRIPASVCAPQRLNLACALAALETEEPGRSDSPPLQWSCAEVAAVVDRIQLPGRLELIESPLPLLLDGAHTPASIDHFVTTFVEYRADHRGCLLLGMMADKDAHEIIDPIAAICPPPRIATVTTPSPRAASAGDLAALLHRRGLSPEVFDDPLHGFDWLKKQAADGKPTAATGSMHLAGWIRRLWR